MNYRIVFRCGRRVTWHRVEPKMLKALFALKVAERMGEEVHCKRYMQQDLILIFCKPCSQIFCLEVSAEGSA